MCPAWAAILSLPRDQHAPQGWDRPAQPHPENVSAGAKVGPQSSSPRLAKTRWRAGAGGPALPTQEGRW